MPNLPKFQDWPDDANSVDPADIPGIYAAGFAGARHDPAAIKSLREHLEMSGGYVNGYLAAAAFGLTGSAAGQLVIPFQYIEKLYPGGMPGAAQARGDCVSHGTMHACLMTMCCEVVAGQPDEVTGQIEGAPIVPPEGILQGILSSESLYWWRGYNGDGWSCPAAAQVVLKQAGCAWPRVAYAELGVDLTRYSGRNAGLYGGRTPPDTFLQLGQKHLIRTATELGSFEEIRDFLANGYGISSCGSEGFSASRDENGLSRRQGSWSHAMAYYGADDRDCIKQKYGEPLVLVMNSWGKWNDGSRRILDTTLDIPEGSFWARYSDVKRRYAVAFSSTNGWQAQQLPNYGAETFL